MTDHAKRINAIRQRVADHERIDDMERRSAPLFWVVYLVAFVVAIVTIWWQ